ncbi:MAG TPA: hypothetical protein PKE63_11140, partial [Lacibacter sp.]|nr:hypothetical protein [Lacibacter sp.]
MKQYLNSYFLILLASLFISCEKEVEPGQLKPYFKLTVNGAKKTVEACGTSDHVAQFLQDTLVFAAFGCGEQRAGFRLLGPVTDGTYELDHQHMAWYEESFVTYYTDSLRRGTLTVRSGSFQAAGGSIPYIEGRFSYEAIDKNTGKTIRVSNG